MPVLELQRTAGNRAASIAIQRRPNDADTVYAPTDDTEQPRTGLGNDGAGAQQVPPGAPKPRKMTGYIGMNPGANKELTKLKKAAGEENVLSTTGDARLEELLAEDPAIYDFVFEDLKIPMGKVDRWSKAVDAIRNTQVKARDSVAELIRWMNRAENGEIVLDRLVLSGHSNGVQLWGTPASRHAPQKPGTIIIEQELSNVAAAFPAAAAQVRSVMFSACETVGAVESVIRVFPNIDSVWAYAGFSPDVDGGSGEHINAWQSATAGGGTPNRKAAKGATAIWTRADKWIVHDPGKGNFATMYAQATTLFEGPVRNVMRGTKEINQGELNDIYNRIQDVFRHPSANEYQKKDSGRMMQVILRLRHWEPIRKHFAETRTPELADTYKAIGMEQPNWATITRAELYRHMQAINRKTASWKGDKAVLDKLEDVVFKGLFDLENEKVIPVEWNE